MKIVIKKSVSLLIVISILSTLVAFTTDKNSNFEFDNLSTDEMKSFLVERNYPLDYLNTLIPQQIEVLYLTAYENDGYFYGLSEKSDIVPFGNIPTNQLDFRVVHTFTSVKRNGVTYFTKFFVTINYEWTKLPVARGIDAITVNWDSDLLKYDGGFVSYDYAQSYTTDWITYKTWYAPKDLDQGGLGIDTYIDYGELMGDSYINACGLKGTVTFSLVPETSYSMSIDPGYSKTNINATYTHNKNPLGGSLSFTHISGFGIAVAPGVLQDSISAPTDILYRKVT